MRRGWYLLILPYRGCSFEAKRKHPRYELFGSDGICYRLFSLEPGPDQFRIEPKEAA